MKLNRRHPSNRPYRLSSKAGLMRSRYSKPSVKPEAKAQVTQPRRETTQARANQKPVAKAAPSLDEQIRIVCKIGDREDLAEAFIREGITAQEATTRLLSMKRTGDSLIRDAQRRAAEVTGNQ
ncbi:MAG: hypothetical protein SWQ30_07820 [Thermodesulfobacteriota bacterium]|nr:hypothetical protein [Thermodesulfobacteriota bacterium]